MRRSSSLVLISAAALSLPSFLACGSNDAPPSQGGGSGSSSASSGSNGSGSSSGVSSGGGGGSGAAGSGASGSGGAGGGSGAGSGASGSGAGGGGSGSVADAGPVTGSDGGPLLAADGGPITRACMPKSGDVLADFEEGLGTLVRQGGRTGWWYVFNDMTGGLQTPTAVANGPIAVAPAPADDMPGACNMWAMHSTSSVHTGAAQYSGFGATFVPSGMSKTAYDLSAYSGIQFDVKTGGTGPQGPIYLEILTTESQPASTGGTATNQTINLYNTRGRVLTDTDITTSMQTVYVPFSLLIPRYFPAPPAMASSTTGCPSGAVCQAPVFNPAHALGFQFSQYYDFSKTGAYDLWVDNVALYKGDNGLAPAGATMPAWSDGGASWKCTRPQFEGTNVASGKYLYSAYTKWKSRFVIPDSGGFRVQRPESGNDTVSEGIGYGMLIAVSMNDQALFDGLWKYWTSHLAVGQLMTWITGGSGSATDADEDAAFALVMAGKRWGGTYAATAATVIGDVWNHDIDAGSSTPKGGSNYGSPVPTNPSYFAPAYYRVFAGIDAGHAWGAVADKVLSLLNGSISGSKGLVPAWCGSGCTSSATNSGSATPATDVIYQYDAHRTPWRVGLDYCWNQTPAAATYLAKTSAFFSGVAMGGIDRVVDEYNLDGSPYTQMPPGLPNSMSIVGAAAVGALAGGATYSNFVNASWQFVLDGLNRGTLDAPVAGMPGGYSYFNATVGLLTAITMSGNFNHP